MRTTFFERNLRGRMLLISAQRHIAQQFIAYPSGITPGSEGFVFHDEAGRDAFLIVTRLLRTLEMEFRVKRFRNREGRRRAA